MKKYIKIKSFMRYLMIVPLAMVFSCSDYLDVVPDNIPTIDYAFLDRRQAENYLASLFAFMPKTGSPTANPALLGGDELWFGDRTSGVNTDLWRYVARGVNMSDDPHPNYFASYLKDKDGNDSENPRGGEFLFTALRDCNILLENINKPYDLYSDTKNRWIAEVKFLKAYYHFWLLRMYGPIPLIKVNSSIDEPATAARESVDDCIDYIVHLLDTACVEDGLPEELASPMLEAGRPTVLIAKALKAQVLTYAASPLFNGNEIARADKQNNPLGQTYEKLFPVYDAQKWIRAKEALREALDLAHELEYRLYRFEDDMMIDTEEPGQTLLRQPTIDAMQVRGAVTVHQSVLGWNSELIWGDPRGCKEIHQSCIPLFGYQGGNTSSMGGGTIHHNYAPTLDIVEQFYTQNGLPIADDIEWQTSHASWTDKTETGLYSQRGIPDYKKYPDVGCLIVRGRENTNDTATAVLHFDREPRFYGAITFARARHYGVSLLMCLRDTSAYWDDQAIDWFGNFNFRNAERFPVTGYICNKLSSFLDMYPTEGSGFNIHVASGNPAPQKQDYPFPIIRLADLYLMYAEALNETGDKDGAIAYVDSVRKRTAIPGIVATWTSPASDGKVTDFDGVTRHDYDTKEGLRCIIRRERLNEFAFEGIRFWDLRRWMIAKTVLNKEIRGLNVPYKTLTNTSMPSDFYKPTKLWTMRFEDKDYFFPIKLSSIIKNANLLQSPHWK
ncbi:MAG: RagB/SusD family nutrient uptake outer membrane protein [Dysgonamonadaceae bacterium]|jgi:hypothetical protein|nr:RagB/SusD family nutrient uptake outer membrane protein [Dysgonamonadaceae bacterium]